MRLFHSFYSVNYRYRYTFLLKLHATNKNSTATCKWISKYGRRAMVSNRSNVFHAKIMVVALLRLLEDIRHHPDVSHLSRVVRRFFSYVCIGSFLHVYTHTRAHNGVSRSAIEILFTKRRGVSSFQY